MNTDLRTARENFQILPVIIGVHLGLQKGIETNAL